MVALALAGIGIGTTVVPITSSVLAAVPPERSGMAASASNTSREMVLSPGSRCSARWCTRSYTPASSRR